jgi:hypothetical protein
MPAVNEPEGNKPICFQLIADQATCPVQSGLDRFWPQVEQFSRSIYTHSFNDTRHEDEPIDLGKIIRILGFDIMPKDSPRNPIETVVFLA